jgi:hypothetical protein
LELRETVLDGRIRLLSVLVLPPLGFSALFTDVWRRFPDLYPDKPAGRLAFAILAALSVAAAVFGTWVARRNWWRPARWRLLTGRFITIYIVAVIVAGPAYGFIVIEQPVVQAIVVVGSWSVFGVLPFTWLSRLAERGADAIALSPAAQLAGSRLEVLIPPYRMTMLDENMGWRERRDYRKQLQLEPLYLGVGLDALWLETSGAANSVSSTRRIATLSLAKVTNTELRMITADQAYVPAGNNDMTLTARKGRTVAVTFGDLGEWLFPCPVDGGNVVDLVRHRAEATRKRRPRGKQVS